MKAQIETARLRLRPIAVADIDAMHAIWLEPDVLRYLLDGEQVPRTRLEEVVATSDELFEKHDCGLWCVETAAAQELAGFAGFWFFHQPPLLELMYGLAPAYWRRGFASEASRALLRYGFENLGLDQIHTSTDVPNAASLRVMERCGFTFARRSEEGLWGTLHYALARPAWLCPAEPFTVSLLDAGR